MKLLLDENLPIRLKYRFGSSINVGTVRHENHPVTLETNEMIDDRINYIHENPVRSGICFEARDYKYSSAGQYCGEIGVLEIELVD